MKAETNLFLNMYRALRSFIAVVLSKLVIGAKTFCSSDMVFTPFFLSTEVRKCLNGFVVYHLINCANALFTVGSVVSGSVG